MPGKSFVVTSGKGGVGKTTVTSNLGGALALRGRKVCVVDADIGLRNLDVVMGLENRIVYDLVQVIEGECKLKKALIKHRKTDGLFLLPASQTRSKEDITPEQMKELILKLKEEEEFDYILIDCPAGIDQGFRNAVAGVDDAIIVTTPEISAIRDADKVIALLQIEEIYDPKLIINRLSFDMVKKKDMMDKDDIIDVLAIKLLGVVPEDDQVIVSTSKGEPIVFTDNNSGSAAAFKRIARRIEGENVPLYGENGGFLARLKRAFGLDRKETNNV
ncbi:TPA: septum site-determining protein MinD [Candidatus Poribacteria bacterium]|nr:septum site-determining protein MinD [Candidatus Poribacteria bacterium]